MPTIREQLRQIVTRDGKTVRIPELLEKELDELESLISQSVIEAREGWHKSAYGKCVIFNDDTQQFELLTKDNGDEELKTLANKGGES